MTSQRTLLVAVALAVLVAIYILLAPGGIEVPKSVAPAPESSEAPAAKDTKPATPPSP